MLLSHPRDKWFYTAAQALGDLGPKAEMAVPALKGVYMRLTLKQQDSYLKAIAIVLTLYEIGEAARPVLLDVCSGEVPYGGAATDILIELPESWKKAHGNRLSKCTEGGIIARDALYEEESKRRQFQRNYQGPARPDVWPSARAQQNPTAR
jgi:hypothetical protein